MRRRAYDFLDWIDDRHGPGGPDTRAVLVVVAAMSFNLPDGLTESALDRLLELDDEPERDLTDADLEEAYLDYLDQEAAGPVQDHL